MHFWLRYFVLASTSTPYPIGNGAVVTMRQGVMFHIETSFDWIRKCFVSNIASAYSSLVAVFTDVYRKQHMPSKTDDKTCIVNCPTDYSWGFGRIASTTCDWSLMCLFNSLKTQLYERHLKCPNVVWKTITSVSIRWVGLLEISLIGT